MSQPIPARSCDGCTMCCKLLEIKELQKPALSWCSHCAVGKGCSIYETRPQSCRAFNCAWLSTSSLDERWRPSASKLVLAFDENAKRIYVHAERSDVWRKEPYYSRIKAWANEYWKAGGQVLVWQGRDVIAVLPTKEVNLGEVRDDQRVCTRETVSALGAEYDVVVMENASS